MKPFGWEIVNQISSSDLVTLDSFKDGLKKGYQDGWLDFFVDMPNFEKLFSVEDEHGLKHTEYKESLGYKLGYTLALNDCLRLVRLGEDLNSKLSEALKDSYLR